jgi:pSer/pThr/pTyr-binding forkhead associated (FHA) protein
MNCGAQLPAPAPAEAPEGVCPSCGYDKNPEHAQFCMNCGAQLPAPEPELPTEPAPAKLVLSNAREIVIAERKNIIGRGDFLQDLSPEEAKFLSREHITIMYEDEKYYITDENSTNGTTLNGTQIKGQGKQELIDNDEIALADTITVTFRCQ